MDILAKGSTFLVVNKMIPIQIFVDLGNEHQYLTTTRHDLSMVEVANEDVAQMLTRQCGCCGSEYRCFRIPTQAEIDLWKSPI